MLKPHGGDEPMSNKMLALLSILGLLVLFSPTIGSSQDNAGHNINPTITPNYSVYLPIITKNWPPISIEIVRPAQGEPVEDGYWLVVTVESLYELQAVIARVENREISLGFSEWCERMCYPAWIGNLPLAGLERGGKLLTVIATDVLGNSVQAQRLFFCDQKPNLTVIAPLNETVALPEIYLRATCTDDDPVGCVLLTVTIQDRLVSTSQHNIDETVSLAEYDGQIVMLQFEAQDSTGRYTREERTVYVESSTKLVEVEAVGGRIWDVQPGRILFLEKTEDRNLLKILDRASGQETTVIDEIGKQPQYGYLTPLGAIFVEQSGDYETATLYEWRDGELIELSPPPPFLVRSLRVAGNYAIWEDSSVAYLGTLVIRDLIAGTNTVLSPEDVGTQQIAGPDVATNGDVVWYSEWEGKYQIFRYRQGAATQLTSDEYFGNVGPRTDGINVVYEKRPPPSPNKEYQIAMYGATGEIILTAPRLQEPYPDEHYQANNGWVAFTEPSPGSQVLQVRVRSPFGQHSQLSYFSTSSYIDALGPNGETAFTNTNQNRRYFSVPNYDSLPTHISSALGWSFWQEGQLFVVIGRSLFKVQS
jgi:hypothetical protein